MIETKTHHRTCNICEAMCGISVEHEGTNVLSIKPDKDDPFSLGHICPKAVALQDYYHDPERLKTPLRKTPNGGYEEITWETAFDSIATNIRSIQKAHGNDSVGIYLGNPNAHNFGNAIFLPHFFKAVGTKNRYSSASADQLPHHVAANYMLGAGMAISVPDVNRTNFMLIIGGNPMVSNGSMMSAAGMPKRLKNIKQRGGQIVVIDPRRTETAKLATQHLFIRPETDAVLLLALIHVIFDDELTEYRHLENKLVNIETLKAVAADYPPELAEGITGIAASEIRSLAKDFVGASSAVCYSRMGASTQSFGGLCQWLTLALNIISGNFDREGGAMFPQPAFDLLQRVKPGKPSSYGRFESRVSKLPYFNSEFPIAALAEEIMTPGDGQIKALFTIAGNPVLSAPNGDALDHAFSQLDFMVSVDIYKNETTKHADIILPATHGLEVAHFDVFFNSFAVSNTVKYSPPTLERTGDQKHDWEILKGLASALTGIPDDGSTPEYFLDLGLKGGAYGSEGMSLKTLLDAPHGIDLGPLKPCIESRLKTVDGTINMSPDIFVKDLPRLKNFIQSQSSQTQEFPFLMISRRLARNHNTWTHNSYRLIKGKNPVTLQIHPADAERLGLAHGDQASVASRTGAVVIEVDINADMMPGVVSIPQGWGHNHKDTAMTIAAQQPGVSINSLTDHLRIDRLTGNAAFNGTPVAISKH